MCPNCYWIGPSLSLGICQVSIMLFYHVILSYYALSSFLSHYVICPYPYSSLDYFLSHDNAFPLSLLIHSFSQPTSFPDQRANHCVPTFYFAKAVKVMEPLYQPNS